MGFSSGDVVRWFGGLAMEVDRVGFGGVVYLRTFGPNLNGGRCYAAWASDCEAIEDPEPVEVGDLDAPARLEGLGFRLADTVEHGLAYVLRSGSVCLVSAGPGTLCVHAGAPEYGEHEPGHVAAVAVALRDLLGEGWTLLESEACDEWGHFFVEAGSRCIACRIEYGPAAFSEA